MPRPDGALPLEEQIHAALQERAYELAMQRMVCYYGGTVIGFCIRMMGEKARGEDVAQEVFVAAIEQLQTYTRQQATIRAWLLGIARKQCASSWRSTSRRQRLDEERRETIRGATHPNPPVDPAEEVSAAQQRGRLLQCLQRLSLRDRTLVNQYQAGLSVAEIARQLRGWTSEATVRRRLHMVIARLRRCLDEERTS